ncbi:hypothetical protein D046_0006A, partial [Vibrio parahaemolyticus V-223/04]
MSNAIQKPPHTT